MEALAGSPLWYAKCLAVLWDNGIINFFSGAYICQLLRCGLRFLPKVQEAADRGCGKRRSRSDFPFQRFWKNRER